MTIDSSGHLLDPAEAVSPPREGYWERAEKVWKQKGAELFNNLDKHRKNGLWDNKTTEGHIEYTLLLMAVLIDQRLKEKECGQKSTDIEINQRLQRLVEMRNRGVWGLMELLEENQKLIEKNQRLLVTMQEVVESPSRWERSKEIGHKIVDALYKEIKINFNTISEADTQYVQSIIISIFALIDQGALSSAHQEMIALLQEGVKPTDLKIQLIDRMFRDEDYSDLKVSEGLIKHARGIVSRLKLLIKEGTNDYKITG